MANIVRRAVNFLTGNGVDRTSEGLPAQPSKAVDDLIAQRVWNTGIGPTGGNYCGETPEVRRRYDEMLREPMIKIGVLSKVWDVAAQTLSFAPVDKKNDRDKLIAEFNTDNIKNAKGGVLAVVESLLFGTLKDGYGVCHKKKRDEDRGKWTGKRVLSELRPKDSAYYDLIYDQFRNLEWVKDRYPEANDPTEGYHDPGEFVVTYHIRIFDSPWGMSDFRAADRAYCCKDAATKLRMIYLDKYSGPFVEGKYSDKAIKNELLNDLKQMRAGGVVVYPDGTEIKITEAAMSAADAFQSAIADWNEEMVVGISFGFLQFLGGQIPGGAGRSSEHAQSTKVARWYLAQLVCNAVSDQIGREATDENFAGTPPYPKANISSIDPDFVVKDLEVAALMLDMGLGLDEDELHERGTWRQGEFRKAAPVPIPTTVTGAAVPGKATAPPNANPAPNGKPLPAGGAKP